MEVGKKQKEMVACVAVGKEKRKRNKVAQGNCGENRNKREDKEEVKAEIYNMNMVGEVGGQ